MVKQFRLRSKESTWCGVNPGLLEVSFQDLLIAWEKLLAHGWCVLGSTLFAVEGREVKELF